ncbi:calmodulin-like [Agrilus planipennis]|uniref:Calmodulin-like n=1 Tax=Agrilus planipennis TaxID=224129 RepID=A0A1W4WTM5_AGRPL|nr:calmodulin-like [Agrilus planipennis]
MCSPGNPPWPIVYPFDEIIAKFLGELTEEEIENIRESYALYDDDDSRGLINAETFKTLMTDCGQNPTDEQIKEWMETLDEDKDGLIGFPEFLTLVADILRGTDDPIPLREAFQALDRDEDLHLFFDHYQLCRSFDFEGYSGYNLASELNYYITQTENKITQEESYEMFRELEIDWDGLIPYEKFVTLLSNRNI